MTDTLFGHAGGACRSDLADARKEARKAGVGSVKGLWTYKTGAFRRFGEQAIEVWQENEKVTSYDTCCGAAAKALWLRHLVFAHTT
jgi:hypothetical protein